MGHVIVKQVTRPDYGAVPGETFPYEHEFAEPVHWALAVIDDPSAPPYRTPTAQDEAPAQEAHVQQHAQARVQAQGGAGRGQAKEGGA